MTFKGAGDHKSTIRIFGEGQQSREVLNELGSSASSSEPPKCQGLKGTTVQQGEVSREPREIWGFSDHPFLKGSGKTLQRGSGP